MKGVKISWNFSRKGVKVLLLLVKVYGILVGMGLKCFCCCSKGAKVSWNGHRWKLISSILSTSDVIGMQCVS